MKTHLLVCKPQLPACCAAQRQSLASQLRLGGHIEMLALPLFELLPHQTRLTQVHTWMGEPTTRRYKILVCVSPSALEMLCYNMGPWPTQLFCGLMGKQSAALALQLGVPERCIIAPTGQGEDTEDSEGLATLIRQRFETGTCEIFICKGPRGRTDLLNSLQVLGHDVQTLECYDRRELHLPPSEIQNVLGLSGPMVLWVTSSETLLALDQQFKTHSPLDYLRFQTLVTVLTAHPRIRSKCIELGYSSVIQISTGIQSLNEWLQNNTMNMTPERQSDSVARTHNQRRFDRSLPKLALGLSLVSMVLSVAIGLSSRSQVDKARVAFGERLERETATLDLLKEQVGEAGDLSKDLKTRFELLEQTQKEEESQRQSLQEVYNSLLSNRIEVSLSEVEQLLSIAKRQLYVLGNVRGAAIALEQAVEVLAKTDKPTMIALRKALQMDLSEIQALPHTDVMKLAVDLDVLINSVESLPMLSGLVQPQETGQTAMNDEAQTQMDKKNTAPEVSSTVDHTVQDTPKKSNVSVGELLNSVGLFFKSVWEDMRALVQITEVKSVDVLLLSARQEADVKNVLRLSLLNARITLLSRQTELLNADLERSSKLIETYFDSQAPLVQQAHGVLDSIHQAQLNLVLPELKASSSALRLAQASQPTSGNKP